MIAVDASVVASALIEDDNEGRGVRLRLRSEEMLLAPEIIDLEVANAWRRDLHAGRLDETRTQEALDDLASLRLLRISHQPLMGRIWELRHNLTPYDAAYVAVAEAFGLTLLTIDGRSTRAPSLRCAVELL